MEILSHLAIGFDVALSPANLGYCLLGAVLGTLVGILPGLGPTATIAMLLPLTFSIDPAAALIMLAGIYYGAQYGGSTTAILLNLPGEASAAVTAIDGYQMARKGRAGAALSIAAIGSFVAGCVATLLVAVCAPLLVRVAQSFSPFEYFSLIVLGLVCSIALSKASVLKALGMVFLGLGLGTIGTDVYTGDARFTMGLFELADGLSIVALSVGLFGLAEIFRNLEGQANGQTATVAKIGSLLPSRDELRASRGPIVRGTVIGSFLGVLPGGGALLSSFVSYSLEKRISKDPSRFGHGAIEGVASPESANNAGAQTSFIPMLALGIPSNAVMALMIGAMVIQGIVPGPLVIDKHPELFWGIIVSMWVGNAMLVVLNLPLVGVWVRLLQIPYFVLFPAIVAFCVIGTYTVNNTTFDLYLLIIFAVLGYGLSKIDCEPAPLLLGFVLGPLMEEHFRRAMVLSKGDFFAFLTHPISAVLLILAALLLVFLLLPTIRARREQVFVDD
ncbi:tripartite tricarboxylate transporter permease [Aminobacter aminovorans]|uniref:TctA family transporter n=1 Tax=Aminobacter aminovorans TaxID=83263 RepID=A0AAC8YKP6_AMIAI|nr:tripartite tricarboxylate transporter permease [Aminobacter aminovorans]AMS40122.1 hypothetical protein AA2016_1186 [Aminobacter aminovorans]MBB3710129.1 TctA family transporter [Aminobacter aminovorans]